MTPNQLHRMQKTVEGFWMNVTDDGPQTAEHRAVAAALLLASRALGDLNRKKREVVE